MTTSDATKKLENELSNFKLKEDTEFSAKRMVELNKQMRDNLSKDIDLIDYDKIEKYGNFNKPYKGIATKRIPTNIQIIV